ncbi:MAG: IPT/TIG domain-containing protein [Allomuricauda sp.]
MKRIVLVASLILCAGLAVLSCSKDDGPTESTQQSPKIDGFSPTMGPVGTNISITGKNFSATASANTVKIGNTTATVTSASATKIFITVPQGATTGKISVTVGGKTDTAGTFTVTEPVADFPIVEKIINTNGLQEINPTDIIAIVGSGFNPLETYNVIFSGGVQGTIKLIEEGFIRVEVPEGATTGNIILEYNNLSNAIGQVVIVPNPTTYVVGYVSNGNTDTPKLWIDGVPEDIVNSKSVNSIYVDGSDIYVAGKSIDEKATVWINGEPEYLTDGTTEAEANTVVVANGSYYVAGYVATDQNTSKAVTWKDGDVLYEYTDGSSPAAANSLTIKNDIVYAVGYLYDEVKSKDVPMLWINEQANELIGAPSTDSGRSSDVIIDEDGIIYAVGYLNSGNEIRGIRWRYGSSGNTFGDIGKETYISSILLNGTSGVFDSYMAGHMEAETGSIAVLWKSGIQSNLTTTENNGEAYDVAVHKEDVYVVGFENDIAKIWKNGESFLDLNDGNNNFGRAYSIVIK